ELLPQVDDIAEAWRWAAAHGRLDLIAAAAPGLGTLLVVAGRFEEISRLCAQAQDVAAQAHPGLVPVFAAFRAMAAFRLGRIEEAQTHAADGLEAHPEGHALTLLHLVLSRAHRFHGRHAQALTHARAAVQALGDDGHRPYIRLHAMEE